MGASKMATLPKSAIATPPESVVDHGYYFVSCFVEKIFNRSAEPAWSLLSMLPPPTVDILEMRRRDGICRSIFETVLSVPGYREHAIREGMSVGPVWLKGTESDIYVITTPDVRLERSVVETIVLEHSCGVIVQGGGIRSVADVQEQPISYDIIEAKNNEALDLLAPGCSIGERQRPGGGTLGGFLEDELGNVYLETCSHVVPDLLSEVIHPSNRDMATLRINLQAALKEHRLSINAAQQRKELAAEAGRDLESYDTALLARTRDLQIVQTSAERLELFPMAVGRVVQTMKCVEDEFDDLSKYLSDYESKAAMVEKMDVEGCPAQAVLLEKVEENDIHFRLNGVTLDTAIILLDNAIFFDPILRNGNKITKLLDLRVGMEITKTGRTTGVTKGVVVGRRYVMMPRSGTVTREWCFQTHSGPNVFSAPADSGGWCSEKDGVAAKIMGQFSATAIVQMSVLSPMKGCIRRVSELEGKELKLAV